MLLCYLVRVPVISQFYGIKIRMFYSDHGEPHLHAYYAEYQAKFTINSGVVMTGHLPRKAERLVKQWIDVRKNELYENWERALKHEVLHYIAPIE